MGKSRSRILVSTFLAIGWTTSALWAAGGTSGDSKTTESSWRSADSGGAVSFVPTRSPIRTAELGAESLDDTAVRPVALQGVWAPEESPGKLTPQEEILTPEAIMPQVDRSKMGGEIQLPGNTVVNLDDPNGLNLPSDMPSVLPPSENVPVENPSANRPAPITPFNPNINTPAMPENGNSFIDEIKKSTSIKPAVKKESVKLQKSETRIDRFGNIGSFGAMNNQRTEDGTVLGNPYATGQHEYHPRCFNVDPSAQLRLRTAPPAAAYGEDGYGNVAYSCGGCGVCAECCGESCDTTCVTPCGCGLFPRAWWLLQNAQFEAGVFAFKDPFEIGQDNNFGYNLALNWSTPSRLICGLVGQAGVRFQQTGEEDYSIQDANGNDLDDQSRSQFFWTMGFFYRNPGDLWTFGAVYDALREETAMEYTLGQARVELARKISYTTDLGFRGAFAINDELLNFRHNNREYQGQLEVNSYYTAFLRHTFTTGAEGMIFGGATEQSEGLVGGHIEAPITNHSSLRSSFVYVVPKNNRNDFIDNTWSVNISWVVYFGGNSREGMANPLRPLFDVADNTTLLQKAKAK